MEIILNGKNDNIFVVIPALNEEEKIGDIIKEIKSLNLETNIVVVDDGSQDNTAILAEKNGAIVLKHVVNLGQWAALKTAFTISLLKGASIIVTLDADGQHSPQNIETLLEPIFQKKADFIIGTRFRYNLKPDMFWYRYYGIKFFNLLIKLRTGLDLTDCTSGYKAYRAYFLKQLIGNLKENQYGALEAVIEAHNLGAKIYEVPIDTNKSNKTSKGNIKYAYNLLRTVLKDVFL